MKKQPVYICLSLRPTSHAAFPEVAIVGLPSCTVRQMLSPASCTALSQLAQHLYSSILPQCLLASGCLSTEGCIPRITPTSRLHQDPS